MGMDRLNLVVLRCADLEWSRAFYELLGMTFTRHAHGSGPEHFAHEDGRGVFELYPQATGSTGDNTGLGFAAGDLAGAHDTFARAGFQPGAVKENEWGVSFVVRDPDGRRVEIKQV